MIVVSQQDINTRQDGQGDFTRVFAPFSQVTLKAPASYGEFTFDRWIVNGQEAPANQSAVLVTLNSNTRAEARFRPASSGNPVPRLTPLPTPQGQVGFSFQTVPGARYIIENSTRVTSPVWTSVDTRVGTGEPMSFTRSTLANAAAFFRVRVE